MALSEKLFVFLSELVKKNKAPLFSSLIVGFVTYFFCFANKLETMDDLACLFGQGETISSGRWGLEMITRIYPAASIPWLNGIVSILLLSIAVCMIVRMFRIRSKLLSVLLAALLIAFPTQTCTFGYMFTAAPYALSCLLAVSGVYKLSRGGAWKDLLSAVLLLVISLSIYQVYIAVAASLLVVEAFSCTLREEETGSRILRRGGRYIISLVLSMGIYYGITAVVKSVTGIGLNQYAEGNLNEIGDILFGIRVAYTSFVGYFYKGYYDLVSTDVSKVSHTVVAAVVVLLVSAHFREKKNRSGGKLWVALLCLLLLPPAVNCIRIISSLFHNLMLFSFTSVYVLAVVVLEVCGEELKKNRRNAVLDITVLCMLLVVCTNISFANRVYLKMYMQFEQAESFYTSVVAQLMQDEAYTPDAPLCFIGTNDVFYDIPLVDTEQLAGIRDGVIGTYSQTNFLRAYLGLHLNIAGWDVTDVLSEDERVIAMPSYPSSGSIQRIDDYYVVKLG